MSEQHEKQSGEYRAPPEEAGRTFGVLARFGRPYRAVLALGVAATIAVVFFRLALPWPLRWVLEVVYPVGSDFNLADYLPTFGTPAAWLALLYLVLACGAGLMEMCQRVLLARFAAQTVHDLRAVAVQGARRARRHSSGELIARVVGDTARIKARLAGVLVLVPRDGLIFAGVCGLLVWISPPLGGVFVVGGLVAVLIAVRLSHAVANNAQKQRRSEGFYATALQQSLDRGDSDLELEKHNVGSAKKDVHSTRIVAFAMLLMHVVLATTVGIALWLGTEQLVAGTMTAGELFLFVMYAFTGHRRMVRMGRQVAKVGKLRACTRRVAALVDLDVASAAAEESPILRSGLALTGVKLTGRRGSPRIKNITHSLVAGEHVAVVGKPGAGKSSLLQLLAGHAAPSDGFLAWDGAPVNGTALANRVGYLSQEPVFVSSPVFELLGFASPDDLRVADKELLKRIGAWKVIKGFRRGIREKVASRRLSRGEARTLALAAFLLRNDSSVWVLDSPLHHLKPGAAKRRLEAILDAGRGRTVLIALSGEETLAGFDAVCVLRRGKLRFSGAPAAWASQKKETKKLKKKTKRLERLRREEQRAEQREDRRRKRIASERGSRESRELVLAG
jgi:ATP-binding cassette, subfamily B, bacterial